MFGQARRRALTPEEAGQLLARFPLFWWDHTLTLLGTGLRFEDLVFTGPGGGVVAPGTRTVLSRHNSRRTYHGAIAKLADPATLLRPTAARALKTLRTTGPRRPTSSWSRSPTRAEHPTHHHPDRPR